MNKYPLDIIIPVYNEGENIKRVLDKFEKHVETKFRILMIFDHDTDTTFNHFCIEDYNFEILKLKNSSSGAHSAVMTGIEHSNSSSLIIFPADDLINQNIIDKMYNKFQEGCQVVVASRFMEGGSMKGCPLLKSVLVRTASWTLYFFSSIPVRDASNGFRLFSKKLLDYVEIESNKGFTYSIELLVKCRRLGWKIGEVPAKWEERSAGTSRFKVMQWAPSYIKWYLYGLNTTWLFRSKSTVKLKY